MEMREIEFRAWDPIEKIFRYADIFDTDEMSEWVTWDAPEGSPINEGFNWDVLQFTGLLDKNGVKIFEGDRIAALDEVATVSFNDGGFEIGIGKLHTVRLTQQYIVNCGFHVIGNIHEGA
jgi:hypothetical protein